MPLAHVESIPPALTASGASVTRVLDAIFELSSASGRGVSDGALVDAMKGIETRSDVRSAVQALVRQGLLEAQSESKDASQYFLTSRGEKLAAYLHDILATAE